MSTWTPWMENPFSAAFRVADENDISRAAITDVLCQMPEWHSFSAESLFDDLLAEIAYNTDIVVQYDNENQLFRAALDTGE